MKATVDTVEDLNAILTAIGQAGAVGGFLIAVGYAVRRQMRADGEMKGVISAKDVLIAQYLADIARKEAEIVKGDERVKLLEERVRMLESKRD